MSSTSARNSDPPVFIKLLSVSTAHITKEDNQTLLSDDQDACGDLMFDSFEYGYYVYLPSDNQSLVEMDFPFSHAFVLLLHWAMQQDATCIKLDCDGEKYSQLPSFDW
jgi:hypothetical protein